MSQPEPPASPADTAQRQPFVLTPHAERYLIEADTLRRRQLRSSLLHGSDRTWRDRRRIWPAIVAGVIVAAVVAAAIALAGAFHQQEISNTKQHVSSGAGTATAGPTGP